jgi:alkylresorcinol/alkylpyrone synthase
MARIAATATALPGPARPQAELRDLCARLYEGHPRLASLLRLFDRAGVERRHLAFPPDYYFSGRGFEERNRDWLAAAAGLAERAARACLQGRDVDHLYLVTTTGLATPSLDAILAGRLGLRPDVLRSPLFGLGCAGGAGALVRAARAGGRSLVVAVELCGQVFSTQALRPVDVVGSALFGDGAAAVLLTEEGPGPRVAASRSVLFDGTSHLMGWDFTSDGMRLLLSPEVSDFVRERLRGEVEAFLGAIRPRWWMLHPGGRKILEAYRDAFGLDERDLEWTRGSLARIGNAASASVLFILDDLLRSGRPRAGDRGLLAALGPGFAAELALLEW